MAPKAAASKPQARRSERVLPMAEFRRIDHNAAEMGVPVRRLMGNAGKALARAALALVPRSGPGAKPGTPILLLCGKGNNGGDGYAAAAWLAANGPADHPPLCIAVEPAAGAESRHYHASLPAGRVVPWASWRRRRNPPRAAVIVDCLLGSGLAGRPRAPYAAAIRWINEHPAPVLACDIPSGFGSKLAVRPKATLTFHARKQGMTDASCGSITVAPIGIPRAAETDIGIGDLRAGFHAGAVDAHKGDHGRVLVVGGGPFTGAPHYSGLAAYRAGADLVTLWTPARAARVIETWGPDLLIHDGPGDHLVPEHLASIRVALERADALVIGPGVGVEHGTRSLIAAVLDDAARRNIPVVVDADGLDAVTPAWLARHGARTVLTPHGQEFRDLSGARTDAEAAVVRYAKKHRVTVLRKGAVDVVTDGDRTRRCRRGHPGMAVGGTGDVLAGVTGALLARGAGPLEAACAAAYLVGVAGEHAAQVWAHGLTASDVIAALPVAMHDL